MGLAENAISNDTVGKVSGVLLQIDGGFAGVSATAERDGAAGLSRVPTRRCKSAMLITESWPSVARNRPSKLVSYSITRQAQAKFRRACLTPFCDCSQTKAASATNFLRHSVGRCNRMRPEMKWRTENSIVLESCCAEP